MSNEGLRGTVLIAGDVPKRPCSEHRYVRPSEHGAVEYGQRNRTRARVGLSTQSARQSARTRIVQSGRAVVSSGNTMQLSARERAEKDSTLSGGATTQTNMSMPESNSSLGSNLDNRRRTLIKRFIAQNAEHIGVLEPEVKGRPLDEQVTIMEGNLHREYRGDFVRFFNDLQKDEQDLRLKTSHQVHGTIHPNPIFTPPPSVYMDGYHTARAKHQEQLRRCLASARQKGPPTTPGGSLSPTYNRTKGTIPGYGNFSSWTKYRQLNATAMMNR